MKKIYIIAVLILLFVLHPFCLAQINNNHNPNLPTHVHKFSEIDNHHKSQQNHQNDLNCCSYPESALSSSIDIKTKAQNSAIYATGNLFSTEPFRFFITKTRSPDFNQTLSKPPPLIGIIVKKE